MVSSTKFSQHEHFTGARSGCQAKVHTNDQWLLKILVLLCTVEHQHEGSTFYQLIRFAILLTL